MDVMMPQIDGLSLIGRLRLTEDWGRIPIVVVSAKSQPVDRVAAIGAGANGFLAKPFTAQMLRAAIEEYVPISPK
jgi:CheY-like chemotaxis protein